MSCSKVRVFFTYLGKDSHFVLTGNLHAMFVYSSFHVCLHIAHANVFYGLHVPGAH